MICYVVFAALATAAGSAIPTSGEDMLALGIWVLCDIELLKLTFGKGRSR